MPKQLREARERAKAAKATAAAKWQGLEQARAALADADVPAESASINDLPEYKAAMDAKADYDAAAAAVDQAEAAAAALAEVLGDGEPRSPFAATPTIHRGEKPTDAGFANIGEFIAAVRFTPDVLSSRGVQEFHAEQAVTGDGTDGGYLVPTEFSTQILEMPGARQIVRPRATVIPAGGAPDAELEIPSLDQTGAGGMFGGVEVFWQDEESTDDVPETGAKFKQVSVQAKTVTGLITVSNKLMRNAAWATPIFNRLLAASLINAEDYAFLSANGIGKPTGVRNAAGMKYINRDTAGKVLVEDVLAMIGALHPDSMDTAVFIACQALRPQLMALKDHAGNRVYFTGDPTKAIPDTLYGVPVLYTGKVAAAGAKGDLLLVDFNYYLIKDGADLAISTSEHVHFKKNRTVVKIIRSVDGKGWVTGPMVLEDGTTTVAPYVGLDLVAG